MSELPPEGSADKPYRETPWERIVEMHWGGGFVRLEITFPSNCIFDFSTTNADGVTTDTGTISTQSQAIYEVGDAIEKVGEDKEAVISWIMFDEDNPIGMDGVRYESKPVCGRAYLVVHQDITVIADVARPGQNQGTLDRWAAEAQVKYDDMVAIFRQKAQENYITMIGQNATAIDRFMALHPAADLIDITDFRGYASPPGGAGSENEGWGTVTMEYLPTPWSSQGGGAITGELTTFSYPGYISYAWVQGVANSGSPSGGPVLPPFLNPIVYGRYPIDENRNRESYIINLDKLKNDTLNVVIMRGTGAAEADVDLHLAFGQGSFTAGELRTIVSDKAATTSILLVSGKEPVDTVVARINKKGFVV